jgi:hypothetical protein
MKISKECGKSITYQERGIERRGEWGEEEGRGEGGMGKGEKTGGNGGMQ